MRATACVLFCVAPLASLAKENWQPALASELAEQQPTLDANAPAEALEWRLNIDDTGFPDARKIDEYVRYKIFDPGRADSVTRISTYEDGENDHIEVHARLTLPNGQTREFGPKAMKERTLAKEGSTGGLLGWLNGSGAALTEKFLAVPGIERGSILEYHVVRWDYSPLVIEAYSLQRELVPVRKLEFGCHLCQESEDWRASSFVLNKLQGEFKHDEKAQIVSFHATNIPAIVAEPFVGPSSDYAMSVIVGYESYHKYLVPRSGHIESPDTVEPSLGPWAVYATLADWVDRDYGYPTKRVKKLAADLTANAKTDEAKAIAIHDYVLKLRQRDRRHVHPKLSEMRDPASLDDVLDVDDQPEINRTPSDFLWLAVGLYNSAGFEAHTILLPDRTLMRFNPKLVSPAFLADRAVAVRIGTGWRFSAPQRATPLPFGLLPWAQQGQSGLLARDHKQEFIPVPFTSANQSAVLSNGIFTLDAAGTLTGEVRRYYTGQTATTLRTQLRNEATPMEKLAMVREQIGIDTREAEITKLKITGLNKTDEPVIVAAHVWWPGYAARTKERLVIRPAVFRAEAASPFSAAERHYPVSFPYPWQEIDRITIQVPEGFSPEAPSIPAPIAAETLSWKLDLGYDRAHRTLHATRTFTSNLIDVPIDAYSTLKNWYDTIARNDQHDVIFAGHDVPIPDLASISLGFATGQKAGAADEGEGSIDGGDDE